MGHVLIAYDLLVIFIGCSALSIAGYWALKTREAYLRDFFILYALFTAMMILFVLRNYLFLNVPSFTGRSWFILSGIEQIVDTGVVVATIHFFHGIYQIRFRKVLTPAFLVLMVISTILTLSPAGAVLDEAERKIYFGPAFLVANGMYILSFTYALVIGFAFIRRVWLSNTRIFVAGLLLFAMVGYIESLVSYLNVLRNPVVILATETNFLLSSIPYALYGIFLLFYFLQFIIPSTAENLEFSEDLVKEWGITGREHEIILKVLQGKSNADIASELFITLATVKTHLHNIYQKIGIDSRFDLIARVREKRI
jgi:DNA-binding CsgD family transcriptional regulator